MRTSFLLVGMAAVWFTSAQVRAESPGKVPASQLQRLRTAEFAAVIDLLGQGRVEDAVNQLEKLSGRKFKTAEDDPFGVDERSRWIKLFTAMGKAKPQFKEAELVGIQSTSSKVKKMTFVAVGRGGPVLFHFRVYEYGGQYQLGNIGFDAKWERIELQVNAIKDRISHIYRFKSAVAEKTRPPKR